MHLFWMEWVKVKRRRWRSSLCWLGTSWRRVFHFLVKVYFGGMRCSIPEFVSTFGECRCGEERLSALEF